MHENFKKMSEEQDPQSSSLEDSDASENEVEAQPGPSVVQNPFFKKAKRAKRDSDQSDSDLSDSDDDDISEDDDSDQDDSDVEEEKKEPEIDEEDPLIKALKKAQEKAERKSPMDIQTKNEVMDISFHPGQNLIAHGTIKGLISLTEYNIEENIQKYSLKNHQGSVRSLEFDLSGMNLVSGGEDKSWQIIDTETFKVKHKVANAHDASLYKVKPIDENLIITGDEDGTVKLWDRRHHNMSKPVMSDEDSLDSEITDFFHTNKDPNYLMATSGFDGLLQGYSISGKKPDVQSFEPYNDDELNCMGLVHMDSKLVVGTAKGILYLFNWREFGEHSDKFGGHPGAINDLVAVTDNLVITACEDGAIRAVHLFPHRFVGTVGHHALSVERLDVSYDGELIASSSHDNCVKFWNIKYFEEMDYDKTKKPFLDAKGVKMRRKDNKMQRAKESEYQLPSSNRGNRKDFFKELE